MTRSFLSQAITLASWLLISWCDFIQLNFTEGSNSRGSRSEKLLIEGVFITPIFSAGEEIIQGINHHSIAYEMKKLNPNLEIYTPDNNQELIKLIKEKTIEKDLILIMGAGDINTIWGNLFLESVNNKLIKNELAA